MKTYSRAPAQGDVWLRRVDRIPETAKQVPRKGAEPIVVAHSESGHHHAIEAEGVVQFEIDDPLLCYLRVDGDFADLVHHKSGPDAHGTIRIGRGTYEVRRAREWNPWTRSDRRVQD